MEKEECSSSESGWTTYISSPMQEDNDEEADEDVITGEYYGGRMSIYGGETEDEKNKDSDDSMASDASSGPYHQRRKFDFLKINKGRRREGLVFKNEKGEKNYGNGSSGNNKSSNNVNDNIYTHSNNYNHNKNSNSSNTRKKERKNAESKGRYRFMK